MSIYAISDLHLSFGDNKPMDIFGANWENKIPLSHHMTDNASEGLLPQRGCGKHPSAS